MQIERIILASSSSYRAQLLASAGIRFETRAAQIDEQQVVADDPEALAIARAVAKASDVALRFADALIIGADQVLSFSGGILHKVNDVNAARSRLRELSGREHLLHSAFALVVQSQAQPRVLHREVVTASMRMRRLSDEQIDAYVATGEWRGCVGCYQYENKGINLFETVNGDQSTIIGMPLSPLLRALRRLGLEPLTAPNPPWFIE